MSNFDKTKLAIIALMVAMLGVLILIYTSKNNPTPIINPTPTPNSSPAPTPQPSNTPQNLKPIIYGWKVYQNQEYGFRVD